MTPSSAGRVRERCNGTNYSRIAARAALTGQKGSIEGARGESDEEAE